MERKENIYDQETQVKFIFFNSHENIHIAKLSILFNKTALKFSQLLSDFNKKTDDKNDILYGNTYIPLKNQCTALYESVLICHEGKLEETIEKKVSSMRTTPEYKEIIKRFLLILLEKDRIDDLSRLLALLDKIEIRMEKTPLIQNYIPGITTIAAADTSFYYENGIINGQEIGVLNPDHILIRICNTLSLKDQKISLMHELTHIILQPVETDLSININQEQEEKVDKYLSELKIESQEQKEISSILRKNEQGIQRDTNSVNALSRIISELKNAGFDILKQDGELIAFCKERNILYYVGSIKRLIENGELSGCYFYQQPYLTYSNDISIGFCSKLDECVSEKTEFPLFTNDCFLNMNNEGYGVNDPFISSLKKIALYPELYEAVGAENQQLIDDIIAKSKQPH